jgi:hypothetical protein
MAPAQKASMVASRVHRKTRQTVHRAGGGAGFSARGMEKRGIYPRYAEVVIASLNAVVNCAEFNNSEVNYMRPIVKLRRN